MNHGHEYFNIVNFRVSKIPLYQCSLTLKKWKTFQMSYIGLSYVLWYLGKW